MRIPPGVMLMAAFCGAPALAQEKVFFGNLHSHTSYSDGSGLPGEAYDHARNAKLDFLALTEHNHAEAVGSDNIGIGLNHGLYNGSGPDSLISIAKDKTVDGQFVALYGQEFSTISTGNHLNVLDVGEVITVEKGRFDKLLDFLATRKDSDGKPCILMMNHPSDTLDILPKEYGRDDFNGVQDFVKRIGAGTRLIQIINGPGQVAGDGHAPARPDEQAYFKFLNMGFMIAPTADQDNHQKNWGTATPARTAIIAPDLSKKSLLDAIRQRHVYATQDPNLRAIIKVNGKLCGDIIPLLPAQTRLDITYEISDDDEPSADYTIKVFKDSVGLNPAALVDSFPAERDASGKVRGTIDDIVSSGTPQYFFFKVTQVDEDGQEQDVWTAPVWFQNGNEIVASSNENIGLVPPGSAEPAAIDPDLAVASRRSNSFHLSKGCLDAQQIKESNLVSGSEARRGRHLHPGCPRKEEPWKRSAPSGVLQPQAEQPRRPRKSFIRGGARASGPCIDEHALPSRARSAPPRRAVGDKSPPAWGSGMGLPRVQLVTPCRRIGLRKRRRSGARRRDPHRPTPPRPTRIAGLIRPRGPGRGPRGSSARPPARRARGSARPCRSARGMS